MKGRLSVLLAVVALGVGAGGITVGEVAATSANHCSSGYTNANLSWGHKCLRAGQYCKISADRQYRRYRFHCHRSSRDTRGDNHLTR
jgi:hypothetical protein